MGMKTVIGWLESLTPKEAPMARDNARPVIRLRSTEGTGTTYVTRKSRRNTPDRLVLSKYDPRLHRHTRFREER